MLFSSYKFIFIFLPLVFFSYTFLRTKGKISAAKWVLVLASFYFYAYGSGSFFPFFVLSVFFNYAFGTLLGKIKHHDIPTRRLALFTGILGNLLLLVYYKYTDFIIANINLPYSLLFLLIMCVLN